MKDVKLLIDSSEIEILHCSALPYPDHNEDIEKAFGALAQGNKYRYERLIQMVNKRQRLFNGDRSHPRLVALDKLLEGISYSGWESDKEKAETMHLEWENNDDEFNNLLKGMGNKQRVLVDGDRSELAKLDSLAVSATYPDWEEDFRRANHAYFAGFDFRFQRLVQMMEKKARAHVGDRTHPRLVALDSLVLSYPQWEVDVRRAEEAHMKWEEELDKTCDRYLGSFWNIYNVMKEKQKFHLKMQSKSNLSEEETMIHNGGKPQNQLHNGFRGMDIYLVENNPPRDAIPSH